MKPYKKLMYSIKNYLNREDPVLTDEGVKLKAVIQKFGKNTLLNSNELYDLLVQESISAHYALRICIMANVTGLEELLKCDQRTLCSDISRYTSNALNESGFDRSVVLSLLSDILIACGITYSIDSAMDMDESSVPSDFSYPIPNAVYQHELEKIESQFVPIKKKIDKGEPIDDTDISLGVLKPLVAVGLPKAKYYAGYCILYGVKLEEDSRKGIALLQEAANSGCEEAACALADYYYKKGGTSYWGKAYDLYTQFGALALNNSQHEAIKNIYNQKKYNQKILLLCILFAIVSIVIVVIGPAAAVYSTYRFWGILFAIIECALLCIAIRRYQISPYDFMHELPAAMFFMMFLYFAIRLLF